MRLAPTLACVALGACLSPPELAPLRSEEVTWVAEYKAWACGDFTARLLTVDVADSRVDLSRLRLGLVFYVPPGLIAPDQLGEVGVDGNRFLIRGHYFYRETGGRRTVEPRFDLLGWQPVPPFRRWEDGEARLVNEPAHVYARFESSPGEPEEATPSARRGRGPSGSGLLRR